MMTTLSAADLTTLAPIVMIPARMASTRLPDKPLADILGLPMIVRVWERAMAANVGPVVVACAEPEIKAAVAAGYIVRTRADIDTVEARNNDTARREAALASGAQVISTDYLTAPNIFGNAYAVPPFAGGWRCNPVVGACDGQK